MDCLDDRSFFLSFMRSDISEADFKLKNWKCAQDVIGLLCLETVFNGNS